MFVGVKSSLPLKWKVKIHVNFLVCPADYSLPYLGIPSYSDANSCPHLQDQSFFFFFSALFLSYLPAASYTALSAYHAHALTDAHVHAQPGNYARTDRIKLPFHIHLNSSLSLSPPSAPQKDVGHWSEKMLSCIQIFISNYSIIITTVDFTNLSIINIPVGLNFLIKPQTDAWVKSIFFT